MSTPAVHSVNLARPKPTSANSTGVTGIDKHPVAEIEVRAPGPKRGGLGSGAVGDVIGEPRHHGGDTQAVYVVALGELEHWEEELARPLRPGTFGENITVRGLDVDTLPVGQALKVGDEVVLRVCGPRVPCRTFAVHMGERAWVRRFTERGRSGAYCSVEAPGRVRAGDPVRVLDPPEHGIDVSTTFRAFMGDLAEADRVLAAGCLHPQEHQELARVVARRRRAARGDADRTR